MGMPTLFFVLFGNPIEKSPSPILHNSIFTELGIPFANFIKWVLEIFVHNHTRIMKAKKLVKIFWSKQ